MVRALCPVLKLEHYGPDDLIFQQGHLMGGMVFLNSGTFKQFRHVALPQKVEQDQEASGNSEGPLSNYEELPEVIGGSLGAQAILCEHQKRSQTTVLCYTFCELTFLTRADFKRVVDQNPKWGVTLDRIGRILAPFDDNSEVMQALSYGDSKPLEALLPHTSKEEAHQCWNKLRINTKATSIANRALHLLRQSKKQEDVEGKADPSESSDVQGDAPSTGWAQGFQSMQLNAKERHIVQELQQISARQTKMECRLEYRMDKLESMTSETNQMLHRLLSAAQCSAPEAGIQIPKAGLSAENVLKRFPIPATEAPKNECPKKECNDCVKNSPAIAQCSVTETVSATKPTPTTSTASTMSIAPSQDLAQEDIPLISNAHFSKWISQVTEGQKRDMQSEEIPTLE